MKAPIHDAYEQSKLFACWKDAEPFKPSVVKYRVTDRCNARCVMCSYWKKTEFIELPLELVKKVNQEVSEMGTVKILFSGGEPTIHKDIVEMVADASKHGFETSMITNGSMMTKELAEKLIVAGLNRLDFSIDAPFSELHDKIRGFPGLWGRAVQGIKNIQVAAKKHNVKIHTTLSSVVISANYKLIPEMVLMKHTLGIDNIHLYPARSYIGGAESTQMPLSKKEKDEFVKDVIPKIRRNALKTGMGKEKTDALIGSIDPHKMINFKSACFLPLFQATVVQDGRVYPCCHAADQRDVSDFALGDLKKQSFKEIWFGEKFKKFRELCRGDLPNICGPCIYVELNEGIEQTMKEQEFFCEKKVTENINKGVYGKRFVSNQKMLAKN